MKNYQIKTAQNVTVNFELAGIGQRLIAFFVDNIFKITYLYLYYKYFSSSPGNLDGWSLKAIDVLFLAPVTFYSLYSEILMNGQTIGKRLLKIKIVTVDGFKPSISDHIIRWFLRIIDFNLFIILGVYMDALGLIDNEFLVVLMFLIGKLIGFLLIIFTKNNQRFGDIMGKTIAVYLKDKVQFSDTILEEIETKYIPTYPSVIKLSDNDARIIKEIFKPAEVNDDFKMLIKLRTKIIEVTGIESKHTTDKQFIDTVLKDYNFYTQNM